MSQAEASPQRLNRADSLAKSTTSPRPSIERGSQMAMMEERP